MELLRWLFSRLWRKLWWRETEAMKDLRGLQINFRVRTPEEIKARRREWEEQQRKEEQKAQEIASRCKINLEDPELT